MEKFDQKFDREIKELLEQYTPEQAPQWDHMQSKLQNLEEDEAFDHKLKSIFEHAQSSHEQLKWEYFQTKLKQQAERRRKIITARIIESTLFLLFLWTLDNIGISSLIPNQPNLPANVILAVKDKFHEKPIALTPPVEGSHNNDQVTFSRSAPKSFQSGAIGSSVLSEYPNAASNGQERGTNVEHATAFKSSDFGSNTGMAIKTQPENSFGEHTTAEVPSSPFVVPDLAFLSGQSLIALPNPEIHAAEDLQLPVKPTELEQNREESLPLPAHLKPYSNTESKYIGIFSGMMVNTIQSPSFIDPDLKYTQARLAYQTGLRIDIKQDRWNVLTGIAYQNIRYQPNLSETLGSFEGGYYKIHFREIQAHLVNIPVALNKTLIRGKHSELSAQMGLSLTASLKNNFKVDTLTGLSAQGGQTTVFIDTSANSEIISRVRSQTNRGILEGGSIGTNSYASVMLGFRYTRTIQHNVVFFTELEFSKMLGQIGFGPNQDKFLITSLNTGISYRFQ